MKNYKQLVNELPAKKVVFAFGRFQPPTNGHELLVNAVTKLAKAQGADHVIYASKKQEKKENPLPVDRKVYYLKRMFPRVNFVAADETIRTFLEAATLLSKKYKHLVMIAGSDRVPEYKKLLDKYNGNLFNFETIEVVSAGQRDPDSDSAAGMSGTKMREAAKRGDFKTFKKGLPNILTELDGKRLMNELREGMGMEAIKESIQFQRDDLREKYHAGEIFNEGDIVKVHESICTIVKRGANYVLVQESDGQLSNKWLHEVTPATEEEITESKEQLEEMKYSASDKIKVARVIATSLGHDAESSSNPELLVNTALRRIKNKRLSPEGMKILHNMLNLAKEAGIKYDESVVPSSIKEDKVPDEAVPAEHKKPGKVGRTLVKGKGENEYEDQLRSMKAIYAKEEVETDEDEEELDDDDIEDMLKSISDDDHIEDYEDDDFHIIDKETGEKIDEELEEEFQRLDEVLSRAERLRARVRFAKTKAKRERRLEIALKKRSDTKTINKRARRLAIKALKMRLAKRPLSQLSVGEKERIEKIIEKRKKTINRIAMKMVPKVRKFESDRLHHTKG